MNMSILKNFAMGVFYETFSTFEASSFYNLINECSTND